MKRLDIILSLIDDGIGTVDVGTDHCYVPVKLYDRGYSGGIIATDINSGPLEVAAVNIGDRPVTLMQTDGLDGIDPDSVDTVVIAGMGGDLICSILDRAEWTMDGRYKLILQPMTKSEILRYWLTYNGYSIIGEYFDGEYCIIESRFTGINDAYSDREIFLGKNPSPEYLEKQKKAMYYKGICYD